MRVPSHKGKIQGKNFQIAFHRPHLPNEVRLARVDAVDQCGERLTNENPKGSEATKFNTLEIFQAEFSWRNEHILFEPIPNANWHEEGVSINLQNQTVLWYL